MRIDGSDSRRRDLALPSRRPAEIRVRSARRARGAGRDRTRCDRSPRPGTRNEIARPAIAVASAVCDRAARRSVARVFTAVGSPAYARTRETKNRRTRRDSSRHDRYPARSPTASDRAPFLAASRERVARTDRHVGLVPGGQRRRDAAADPELRRAGGPRRPRGLAREVVDRVGSAGRRAANSSPRAVRPPRGLGKGVPLTRPRLPFELRDSVRSSTGPDGVVARFLK